MRHTICAVMLAVATLLWSGCGGEDTDTKGPERPVRAAAANRPDETAEETAISFMMAMSANDEQGVRQRILPHPDPAILWQGEKLTDPQRAGMEKVFGALTFREVHAGESFRLTSGTVTTAGPPLTGEGRKLLVYEPPGGRSLVIPLAKVSGAWRVDASGFVAARKAAKAFRDSKTRPAP